MSIRENKSKTKRLVKRKRLEGKDLNHRSEDIALTHVIVEVRFVVEVTLEGLVRGRKYCQWMVNQPGHGDFIAFD